MATNLESYRRLVELQKQMVELSRQYEQSKSRCTALREQMAREMAAGVRHRMSWRQRVQRSAGKLLKKLPGLGSGAWRIGWFNNKEVSSC